jgi:hypothetical protein
MLLNTTTQSLIASTTAANAIVIAGLFACGASRANVVPFPHVSKRRIVVSRSWRYLMCWQPEQRLNESWFADHSDSWLCRSLAAEAGLDRAGRGLDS